MTKPTDLAEHIALKFHAGQKYGDNDYDYHLEMVVKAVRNHEGERDERLIAIAWLHDILEDTACSVSVLRALFDDDIVDAVIALTFQHYDGRDAVGQDHSSETRDQYLIRVRSNPLARKIKFYDTWCNLHESFDRQDMKHIAKYGKQLAFLAS